MTNERRNAYLISAKHHMLHVGMSYAHASNGNRPGTLDLEQLPFELTVLEQALGEVRISPGRSKARIGIVMHKHDAVIYEIAGQDLG